MANAPTHDVAHLPLSGFVYNISLATFSFLACLVAAEVIIVVRHSSMIFLFHSAMKAHNLSVFTWNIQFVCAFIISYQAVCLAFPLGVFFQVGSDGNLPIIILNSFGS